jgi:PhnB protein
MQERRVSERVETSVAPLLNVRRGKAAVDFYKAAFGAEEISLVESPDGEIVAQLQMGSSSFWLADESPVHKNPGPETLGGSTARMVLVVEEPDAVFAQALSAGAHTVWPVADQRYGWRVGRLVDPFGHHWEIGKPLEK